MPLDSAMRRSGGLLESRARRRPGRDDAIQEHAGFDDFAIIDQREPGFADAALGEPIRQSNIPPT